MPIKKSYILPNTGILFLFLVFVLTQTNIHAQLTLRKKIAQMVMVGYDGITASDSLITDLSKRNLGGVILMGSNIKSPAQVKTVTENIKRAATTFPLIATDQEGGKVARLNSYNGFDDTYTAYQLGSQFNSEDSTRRTAAKMASWLSTSGFNVDFAPVVDVNVYPQSPAIGKYQRSFSAIPLDVARHSSFFINEMNKKFIAVSLKHFPGHGSSLQDSHLGFTDVTTTWADSELVPYRTLFANGFNDIVMAGHLYNAKLDSLYPATLSNSIITGLLRNKLGFNGVVITDDMMMKGVTSNYGFETAIELSINAGVDILLYVAGLRNGSSMLEQVIDVVVNKINEGKIPLARIDESYNRIMLLKQRLSSPSFAERNNKPQIPAGFSLEAYPNPFNPNSNIVFKISKPAFVSIRIYNITGQIVQTLVNSNLNTGDYKYVFNGANLSSGIYLVRMETSEGAVSKKIALVK